MPYLQAWRSFCERTGFESLKHEWIVYNEQFDFAGQLDRIGTIGSQRYLVDIKTGMFFESFWYQTAAYLSCMPQPMRFHRLIVQLKSDATFQIHHRDQSQYGHDFAMFLQALRRARPQIEAAA